MCFSTACLIFIAAIEEFIRTLYKPKKHGNESPKLINFNNAAFDLKVEHDQMETSSFFKNIYSVKQKLHEHILIKRKILRHGQHTNTQKTEQNNAYQPRPPQGTQ